MAISRFPAPLRLVLAALAVFSSAHVVTAFAAGPYDGTWAVTIECPTAADGAYSYTYRFDAKVTDSVLHGEHGTRNAGGWLILDGRIEDDGRAQISAQGLTGPPAYSVGRVERLTPYAYTIDAHFDARNGSGQRIELRRCDVLFVKNS